MSPRKKSLLLQIGFVALGIALLVLALRPVSFDVLWEALRTANYWYLLPMGLVALLSHLVRAWRWLLLLETLPTEEGPPAPVTLRTSFYSVMIGYMVNYAAPRLGEVARAGNLAGQSKLTFSGIFGTVVVERVLDVITLAAGIVIAFLIAAPQMSRLAPLVETATGTIDLSGSVVLVALALVVFAAASGYLIILWFRRRARSSAEPGRIGTIVLAFRDGLMSLLRAPRRFGLVASTVVIWVCYLFMTYLPLPMLGIDHLSLADAWVLLIVGSAAMIVPAPGGVGSYHYVTIHTMTGLFGVAVGAATAYAVLVHASQLVLYAATGFICLLLQGRGLAVRLSPEPDGDADDPTTVSTVPESANAPTSPR